MMKQLACQLLALATLSQAKNIFKEKYHELFLKDSAHAEKREGVEGRDDGAQTRNKQDTSIEDGTVSLNIGDILSQFGLKQFSCQDPVGFTNFEAAKLEGSWYQVYAS